MDDQGFPINFITSWDDGSIFDMRLSELLRKYKIPAIFYIHNNCQLPPQRIKQLHEQGFIIGGHTVNHPSDMKLLTPEMQYSEIRGNKEWLEENYKRIKKEYDDSL